MIFLVFSKLFEQSKRKKIRERMPYIEIKTRKYIDATLAQQIIDKRTVIGILSTGKISTPAKKRFDRAGIAWAENISEDHCMRSDAFEVE